MAIQTEEVSKDMIVPKSSDVVMFGLVLIFFSYQTEDVSKDMIVPKSSDVVMFGSVLLFSLVAWLFRQRKCRRT